MMGGLLIGPGKGSWDDLKLHDWFKRFGRAGNIYFRRHLAQKTRHACHTMHAHCKCMRSIDGPSSGAPNKEVAVKGHMTTPPLT